MSLESNEIIFLRNYSQNSAYIIDLLKIILIELFTIHESSLTKRPNIFPNIQIHEDTHPLYPIRRMPGLLTINSSLVSAKLHPLNFFHYLNLSFKTSADISRSFPRNKKQAFKEI